MHNFIIIDDNKIDLLVAAKAIEISNVAVASVHQFLSATQALDFIRSFRSRSHTIVLIDIQMPIMNGFAFMDEFEKLAEDTKKRFTCMYLTSSSNDLDRLRAQKYPSIRQFINKPFTSDTLLNLLKNLTI